MAWIELHQTLREHPKVIRLAEKLAVHPAEATGLLVNLWLWAVAYAEDGQLRRYTDAEIAQASRWFGQPGDLRCALRETGWEDSDGTIHDWEQYGIRFLLQARRRKARFLKKKQREKVTLRERSENVPVTSTVPYRTVVLKDLKEASADAVSAFTQHFTQALKTKTGSAEPAVVKKAQGVVIGYLKQFPEAWQELTTEVDVLPRGWEPARYLAQVRVMVQQRTHEQLKAMTEGVAK